MIPSLDCHRDSVLKQPYGAPQMTRRRPRWERPTSPARASPAAGRPAPTSPAGTSGATSCSRSSATARWPASPATTRLSRCGPCISNMNRGSACHRHTMRIGMPLPYRASTRGSCISSGSPLGASVRVLAPTMLGSNAVCLLPCRTATSTCSSRGLRGTASPTRTGRAAPAARSTSARSHPDPVTQNSSLCHPTSDSAAGR